MASFLSFYFLSAGLTSAVRHVADCRSRGLKFDPGHVSQFLIFSLFYIIKEIYIFSLYEIFQAPYKEPEAASCLCKTSHQNQQAYQHDL